MFPKHGARWKNSILIWFLVYDSDLDMVLSLQGTYESYLVCVFDSDRLSWYQLAPAFPKTFLLQKRTGEATCIGGRWISHCWADTSE